MLIRSLIGFSCASTLVLTSVATAQSRPAEPAEALAGPPSGGPSAASNLNFVLDGGGQFQFAATFDDGGEVEVGRFRTGLSVRTQLDDRLSLGVSFGYELDLYDFGGGVGFGGLNAWDDVHIVTFGARLQYVVDEEWAIFGGPIVQSAREEDADWNDSLTAGGMLGASLRVDEGLTVGAGLGVVSELQDDALFFPIIIVDWEVASDWRLTTRSTASAGFGAGVELVYDIGDGWEFGIGGNYNRRRFRLDDQGVAPRGIGEDTGFLLQGRLTLKPRPDLTVNFLAGVTLSSEYELESSAGPTLAEIEHDPAAVLGITARFTF